VFWYVPQAGLRTPQARHEARQIANAVSRGEAVGEQFSQMAIFKALQTSAYWAADRPRKQSVADTTRRRWARRWYHIREYLIESNIGLVHSILTRFRSQNVDYDDLLSDALIALQRAVERFNPHRGFRFSTYACNCIIRACIRCSQLAHQHRQKFPVQNEEHMERPAEEPDLDLALRLERLEQILNENQAALNHLEETILRQRFPQDHEERLTFKEIGRSVNLSKERVRQIQNEALDKLRDAFERTGNE
jgi:RNA polymerase sigma factor (sigma-70 family)